ncbi:MAG: urease accessory protein UreD [Roseobacter sp.]
MLMRAAATLDQPRAIGLAALRVKARDGASHIDTLRHSGALKVLFPRATDPMQAIMINTAGGITGGDRFDVAATAGVNTALTISTQAAERAYRAQPNQTGVLRTKLTVEDNATLNWVPQETILFDGAAYARRLDVDLAETARFLMVEPVIFGRRAMGEEPNDLVFSDDIRVNRAGTPLYRDAMCWQGNVAAQLDRPAIAGGARALATLLYVAPDAAAHLDPLREMLGETAGASLLADDVLTARVLAADGFLLRRALLPALDRLTHHKLPISWRL